MKKLIVFILMLFMGIYLNAQNKTVVSSAKNPQQETDEMAIMKKNLNVISSQVKDLQGKFKAISGEHNKKLDNINGNVKSMEQKVDADNVLVNKLDEKTTQMEMTDKTRFNNVTKSILKRSNAIFAFCFLIGLFVLIVSYFFYSTLNKNVNLINASIDDVNHKVKKFAEDLTKTVEIRLEEMKSNNEIKQDEFNNRLTANISEIRDLLNIQLLEQKSALERSIHSVKENISFQIADTKSNFNENLIKNINETKSAIEKQIAVFKNDFYKEITDVNSKVQNLNRNVK